MSCHFFAYLSRMRLIRRWGLMRNTQEENIQEHSLQVAMIAHALAVIGNKYFAKNYDTGNVALIGMYHDVSEVITGDLATPIKYFNPLIKDAYGQIEIVAKKKLLSLLPTDLQADYQELLFSDHQPESVLVKAADKISAYIKCVEELSVGNSEFGQAQKTIEKELNSYELPEVKWFLDNFGDSFRLTIDEMN